MSVLSDYRRETDEPIVVIRGDDGVLRCLPNVCRHRGTVLYDEGRENASSIQCPYHAWSYDNTGRLTGVPYPGNVEIDKASHGLAGIRLETWGDVVFINFDANAEPLSPRLAGHRVGGRAYFETSRWTRSG